MTAQIAHRTTSRHRQHPQSAHRQTPAGVLKVYLRILSCGIPLYGRVHPCLCRIVHAMFDCPEQSQTSPINSCSLKFCYRQSVRLSFTSGFAAIAGKRTCQRPEESACVVFKWPANSTWTISLDCPAPNGTIDPLGVPRN